MPFDFELCFKGLCFFTFQGENRRSPREVNVLLIKGMPQNGQDNGQHADKHTDNDHTRAHVPLLTYRLRDLTPLSSRNGQEILPGPDGEGIGRRRLDGGDGVRDIEIVAPNGTHGLTATWRPEDVPATVLRPRTEADEAWLDWVPNLHQVAPGFPAPDQNARFSGLNRNAIAARIRITAGTLEAAEVARGFNGKYMVWDFRQAGTRVFNPARSQALADRIVLRLTNLDSPVRIVGLDEELAFAPPGLDSRGWARVQASITNMPGQEDSSSQSLAHFGNYYGLIPRTGSPLPQFIPHPSGLLDTTSTLCPPGTHG